MTPFKMNPGVIKAHGTDIFHEVLFALAGSKTALTSYQYVVKEMFQPSEAVLMERILNIGQDYSKLKGFIDSIKIKQFSDSVGLYMLTFAEYLGKALDPYWDDVVLLEHELIKQNHNSLHFIWSKMHRHCELLSGLLCLVNSIVSQHSYGCMLLQHLHQILSSDVGVTRAAVAVIIDGMNEILFRQISFWLLYGALVDNYKEFFIKEDGSNGYCINVAMLPNHIELPLAQKILTVGQTVLFLRSNPKCSDEFLEREEICIDKSGFFGEKERSLMGKIADVREICKWNENGKMENLVSEVSSYVTLQLWTLTVKDAKLLDQLHLVNDFFLLGRGELFHEFVTQVDSCWSKSVTGNIDFNMLLQESATKVLMREESLQRFSLELLRGSPEKEADDSEGEWNRLLVKYDAPWPLQLLFTKEALSSYNKIFRFLLRLKKIEVKLGMCWLLEKSKRHEDNLKRRQLHRNLCFLINNLQYYFHVDVLNSQYVQLETIVKSSKDFECIEKAHSVFLENLRSQLFLVDGSENQTKNPVKKSVTKILELCEEYCEGVGWNVYTEMDNEKINSMLTKFDAYVEFLLNYLTGITNQGVHPSSQHLLQFLLRLDFNSFFSSCFSSSRTTLYSC